MTMANCGTLTAETMGLPASCAVRAEKGPLPKGLFASKAPLSAKTKQHLVHDVASITMLAILRPGNTGLDADSRMGEILVLGLRLAEKAHEVPHDIVELIASQRKSGIVFAVVRTAEHDGTTREECSFAVRRADAGRTGHTPTFHVFHTPWLPIGEAHLATNGSTMGELWDSLCSQIILGTDDFADLDARIARTERIRALEAAVAKLTADHKRAKNPAQRNEIYAKLHKAKNELAALQ